ncbi:MAG: SRPBCC family protein [Terriglobales bacterium]
MTIDFQGDFEVPRSPQEVYAFLSDPERFCPLLPDFQGMERNGDQFKVKLRMGISHIRGTASLRMVLVDTEPPRRARYEGVGDVPGGSVKLTTGFELEPAGGGSKVHWTGQAQVSGRLPSLAGGLLQPLAKSNVDKMIAGLQGALA